MQVVEREMKGPELGKKCQGFNFGDTAVEPAGACLTAECGRDQYSCLGITQPDGVVSKDIAVRICIHMCGMYVSHVFVPGHQSRLYVCIYVYIYIHMYIYMYIYTYIYIYRER